MEQYLAPARASIMSLDFLKRLRFSTAPKPAAPSAGGAAGFSVANPLRGASAPPPSARSPLREKKRGGGYTEATALAISATSAAAAARRRSSLRLLEPLQPAVVNATQRLRGAEEERLQRLAAAEEERRAAFMAERVTIGASRQRAWPPPPPPPPPSPPPAGRPRRSSSEESLQHLEEAISAWSATEAHWVQEDVGGAVVFRNVDTQEVALELPAGGHVTFSPVGARRK